MNYIVSDTDMTSVADAIRIKGNTQAALEFPSGFESAIANLGSDDSTLAALIDKSLRNINVPSGVIRIGEYAFFACIVLTTINIPSSVTEIETYAFSQCQNLRMIVCNAVNPPTLGNNVFSGVPANCAIYVPTASVDAYKAASGWSDRAAYIQAIPT